MPMTHLLMDLHRVGVLERPHGHVHPRVHLGFLDLLEGARGRAWLLGDAPNELALVQRTLSAFAPTLGDARLHGQALLELLEDQGVLGASMMMTVRPAWIAA